MGDILRYPKMMDVWSFGVVTWMILSPTPSIALNGFYPENSSREEMVNVRGVRAHRVGLWRSLEKKCVTSIYGFSILRIPIEHINRTISLFLGYAIDRHDYVQDVIDLQCTDKLSDR